MFLLDSNVLINASRTYYAPDIAPTFWEWLKAQNAAGAIASIARVKEEIDDGEQGHLRAWAASLPKTFWIVPDDQTSPSASRLAAWVMHPDRLYSAAAREEFLGIADYLLVAQAHALGAEVVTFEQPAPNSRRRILIPDACNTLKYEEPPMSVALGFGLFYFVGALAVDIIRTPVSVRRRCAEGVLKMCAARMGGVSGGPLEGVWCFLSRCWFAELKTWPLVIFSAVISVVAIPCFLVRLVRWMVEVYSTFMAGG